MIRKTRKLTAFLLILLLISGCKRSIIDPIPEELITPEPSITDETPEPTNTSVPVEEATATTEPSETTAPPTETPTPTPESPTATAEPEIPTSTPTMQPAEPTTAPTYKSGTLGEVWNLADVRYGLHDDRLRVVVEMVENRDTIPYYEVTIIDNAAHPYPGGHDPAWGEARIDLVVSDLYAYDAPIYGQLPFVIENNPAVTQIGKYLTYDDALLGFSIGLVKEADIKIAELTNPVRIVIDVLYP